MPLRKSGYDGTFPFLAARDAFARAMFGGSLHGPSSQRTNEVKEAPPTPPGARSSLLRGSD
jgi:hypothetical protein